jgi:hypothetical protein
MGVYKNQKLISAFTQFQEIHNINDIPDFDAALQKKHILLIRLVRK